MRASLILSSLFVGAAVATPVTRPKVLHERRDYLPNGWQKREPVSQDAILPMRFGLAPQNLELGHNMLMDVSSHESPNYGKYYTAEEVADMFAPSDDMINAVSDWLRSEGFGNVSLSVNKQWLQMDADVASVEKLLGTKYHVYDHEPTGTSNVACEKYHLPSHLKEHIDYVTPGIKLFATGTRRSNKDVEKRGFGGDSSKGSPGKLPPVIRPLPIPLETILAASASNQSAMCDTAITPLCIMELYNITNGTTAAAGNQLGIFEDLGDVYAQTDLNDFFKALAPQIPQGTHPTLKAIDGAKAPVTLSKAGPESDLDFQISYPIIWPQNSILFQTDDPVYEANYTYEGFLNNFLDAIDGSYCTYSAYGETGNSPLDPQYPDPAPGGYKGKLQCGVYKPTNVISISYGGQEADLPASYQQRQCKEFMKLGLQGVSVLVSSGDSGVAGPAGDDHADGCLGTAGNIFSPDFPATCPYLTAVGATYLPPSGNVLKDQEVAVTRFPSGGGFSNIYPIPSYQTSAVANYFKVNDPPYAYYSSVNNDSFGADGGIYNRLGRGYPDVSAIGDNVLIYNEGKAVLIGGTSASSPTFASIVTRINEERIAAGKATVGFLNPVLYANPQVLHDITVGSNPGCGTNGFSVSTGWDPVTGLGTPNYPALLKLFLSLQ